MEIILNKIMNRADKNWAHFQKLKYYFIKFTFSKKATKIDKIFTGNLTFTT